MLGIDEMSSSALSQSSSATLYYGLRNFTIPTEGGSVEATEVIQTQYFEYFKNFVLKVQNVSSSDTKISTIEIRIDGVLIIKSSDFKKVNLVEKKLKSFTNPAQLDVKIEGAAGSSIDLWIEGTILKLGTVYKGHLYYKSSKGLNWPDAKAYCERFGGHLAIINNANENNFVWDFCNHEEGFAIGLSDFEQQQVWKWVDGTLCRKVEWNFALCADQPIEWTNDACKIITDFSYNNWHSGEPNNCGFREVVGYCMDETYAVFTNDGTWNDVPGTGKFIIEWDFIPTNKVLNELFLEEYK
jgi:hypothetical protein